MNKLISAISKLISAIGRARREGLGEDGIAAVSFAIIAPMLLLISFATLEFSMYMFEQGRATEAARRGARVAGGGRGGGPDKPPPEPARRSA